LYECTKDSTIPKTTETVEHIINSLRLMLEVEATLASILLSILLLLFLFLDIYCLVILYRHCYKSAYLYLLF